MSADTDDKPLELIPVTQVIESGFCGRTKLYALLNAGKIRARIDGGRTLIEAASLEEYKRELPRWTPKG